MNEFLKTSSKGFMKLLISWILWFKYSKHLLSIFPASVLLKITSIFAFIYWNGHLSWRCDFSGKASWIWNMFYMLWYNLLLWKTLQLVYAVKCVVLISTNFFTGRSFGLCYTLVITFHLNGFPVSLSWFSMLFRPRIACNY